MQEFILMADVIDSSSKDAPKLMSTFKQTVSKVNTVFKSQIKSPLTITLGDEFQGIVQSLSAAIEILIYIEEQLIYLGSPFELRFVLNQGEVETQINKVVAYEMLGSGLTEAREQLVAYKKAGVRFHMSLNNEKKEEQLNQSLYLYQFLIDQWKKKDLPVVSLFLQGKDYRDVAKIIGRDESSTWRREKSLGIKAYNTCKELILNLTK